jgi:hypothetical protein
MTLDETQREQVTAWINAGLKLSEIHSRLASELGLKMTYGEARMLMGDLQLVPKDPEPAKPVDSVLKPAQPGAPAAGAPKPGPSSAPAPADAPARPTSGVSITVDELTRPGAMVSGKVTFSDGQEAMWYMDEMGRLGLAPKKTGYRPAAGDVQLFQQALETELAKLGF